MVSRKFLKKCANEMKNNPTPAEAVLWERLSDCQIGFFFWRQYSKKGFIIDFYCKRAKLGIECDGWHHATREGRLKDAARTVKLKKAGIEIIRFWNDDIINSTDRVISEILKSCRLRVKPKKIYFNRDFCIGVKRKTHAGKRFKVIDVDQRNIIVEAEHKHEARKIALQNGFIADRTYEL